MPILSDILKTTRQRLRQSEIETADVDAGLLIMGAFGIDRVRLTTDRDQNYSNQGELQLLETYIERRLNHEPVSRILGMREFWGMVFKVTPDTLDPRPDTELIIEQAVKWTHLAKDAEHQRIIDFGTGTGCILIALLSELKQATGVGVDICNKALAVAQENAQNNGVAGRCEWTGQGWQAYTHYTGEKFDLVVSNPPYISEDEFTNLMPDVRHFDPKSALVAPANGLQAYIELAEILPHLLSDTGLGLFEIGSTQAQQVQEIFIKQGFGQVQTLKDLSGNDRVIAVQR